MGPSTGARGDAVAVLRVRPGTHLLRRSLWSTVEIMLAVTAAHTAAGARVPDLPWLVALAGLVWAASALVLRGSAAPLPMVLLLSAAQVALHEAMWVLASADPGAHVHEPAQGLRMLVAHAVCAGITAGVWAVRRRAVDVVARWLRVRPAAVPRSRGRVPGAAPAGLLRRVLAASGSPRGPPALSRA